MNMQVIIDRRFCGPTDSGNGGYVCGSVAAFVRGSEAVEVTLRRPPPLDRPLNVEAGEDGSVIALDGAEIIAVGTPSALELTMPPAVTLAEAREGAARFRNFENHPNPSCFVCGPARAAGDGLRLFAGRVPERDLVATPWQPYDWLAGPGGAVRPEFVWAALDCPGGYGAADLLAPQFAANPNLRAVLGRQAVRLRAPVRADEPSIVVGWPIGLDGRKVYVGSAILTEGGEVCAEAKATWVILR
jgi:hypothetical protein